MTTCTPDGVLHLRKANGLVADVFQQVHMSELMGHMGIGHTRYPTVGWAPPCSPRPPPLARAARWRMQPPLGRSGRRAIRPWRAPTQAGSSSSAQAQPFYTNTPWGLCLAHNGNLTNIDEVLKSLETGERARARARANEPYAR